MYLKQYNTWGYEFNLPLKKKKISQKLSFCKATETGGREKEQMGKS
jgi:hypothetical protein